MSKKRFLNYFLIALGIFLIAFSPTITGAVIGNGIGKIIGSILGLTLIIGGLVLFLTEREEKESELAILVSSKALEKLKKNKEVRENKKWYFNEINKIAQDPSSRPQEQIGDMNVSPRGQSPQGMRVAWHYDPRKNVLYVLDLLRHKERRRYSEDWNQRVRTGDITRSSYSEFKDYEK